MARSNSMSPFRIEKTMLASVCRTDSVVRCRRWALALACSSALAQSAGCVGLKPGSEEAPSGNDPQFEALSLDDPQWSCLSRAPEPLAPSSQARVTFSMPIVESSSELPPATLQVRACALLDVTCLSPATQPVGPSEDGLVHVSLPTGFDGFLEIRSDDTVPALFFMHEPVQRDTLAPPLPLISGLGVAALAANNGAELDLEDGGLVVVRAFDCSGLPADGVRLSSDTGADVFTFVEGLPRVGLDVTDVAGLGGFMNVPPGFVRVSGEHVASGESTGSESIVVRPQWLTFGDLHPVEEE
jgi:hypothetical protein